MRGKEYSVFRSTGKLRNEKYSPCLDSDNIPIIIRIYLFRYWLYPNRRALHTLWGNYVLQEVQFRNFNFKVCMGAWYLLLVVVVQVDAIVDPYGLKVPEGRNFHQSRSCDFPECPVSLA